MCMINVNDYTAASTSDSETIRCAFKAAKPGDTVRIPRFNRRTGKNEWRIGAAVLLGSGTKLLLDNCRLVKETGSYDNMFRGENGAEGIRIEGEGNALISGGDWNYLSEKMSGRYGMPDVSANALLRFSHVSGLTVKGIRFEMPRWACIMLEYTKDAVLKNLWFDMIPHIQNLYAVYVGCGCSKIDLRELTGRSGEDTILIFADSARYREVNAESSIRDVRIRNLCTDSNRSSMVHIRTNGGHRIHDIAMDCIMDSSDFFEKKRIRSNLELGTVQAELRPARPEELSRVFMKNAFSSAYFTVALDSSVRDSCFENIWTFGDNINVTKNNNPEIRAENISFRRVYYGLGSEPNNSNSFISRYAKGAKPMLLGAVEDAVTVEKLFMPDEEENND